MRSHQDLVQSHGTRGTAIIELADPAVVIGGSLDAAEGRPWFPEGYRPPDDAGKVRRSELRRQRLAEAQP